MYQTFRAKSMLFTEFFGLQWFYLDQKWPIQCCNCNCTIAKAQLLWKEHENTNAMVSFRPFILESTEMIWKYFFYFRKHRSLRIATSIFSLEIKFLYKRINASGFSQRWQGVDRCSFSELKPISFSPRFGLFTANILNV